MKEAIRRHGRNRQLWASIGPSTALTGLALATHFQYGAAPVVVEFSLAVAAGVTSVTAGLQGWHNDIAVGSAALAVSLTQVAISTQYGLTGPTLYAWLVNTAISTIVAALVRHRYTNNHDRHMRAIEVEMARAKLATAQIRHAVVANRSGMAAQLPGQPPRVDQTEQETSLRQAILALYKVELPMVAVALVGDDGSWSASLDLPPQLHRDKLMRELPRLTGALALPGRLEALPGVLSSQVALRYQASDPMSLLVPYEPVVGGSFLDPVLLGIDGYGDPVRVELAYNHVLLAGSSKFGKSNLVKLIALRLAALPDTILLGVDMKPGAPELSLVRGILHDLAVNVEQARAMFNWLVQEMHERGEILTKSGDTTWIPSKHGRPAIVVIVDEFAELTRQGDRVERGEQPISAQTESLLALARGYGITLILATQQPSNRIFGGATDARGNLTVRMSMRMNDAAHGRFLFTGRDWRPGELDAPGKFLMMSPDHGVPHPYKAQFVSDEVCAAEVDRLSRDMVPAPVGHRVILPAPTGLNNQQMIADRLMQYREMSRKELEAGCGLTKDQVLRALRELGPEAVQDRVTNYWSLRPSEGVYAPL